MNGRLASRLGPFLGAALFLAALGLLHHQLRNYSFAEIMASLRGTSGIRLWLAVGLTGCSYTVLTGYDVLALHYIGRRLPYRVAALAGFVGYAFSNNGGFPLLTGGSVRYRLYSAWGLTAVDIGKIMLLSMATFWLGFLTLGAVSFLVSPLPLPTNLHLPFTTARPVGVAAMAIVGTYIGLCAVRQTPLRFRAWEMRLPSFPFALAQLTLSCTDMLLAASVLYVLLPAGMPLTYPAFIGMFVLAVMAGVLSQVPGGLGVFETIMLFLLKPYLSPTAIVGSLFAFRGVYYFLPLVLSAVALGAAEIYRKKHLVTRVGQWMAPLLPTVAPQALAFSTFIGGTVLLVSGATPGMRERMLLLRDIIPLPLLEVSHFTGSVAGMALLLLARGLQRKIDAAYYLSSGLLAVGVVASLVKGLDYEEAVVLTLMLGALLPCRPFFYRRASLLRPQLTPAWTAGIAAAVLATLWLMSFAHRHTEYRHDLWWQFALFEHASRSLRAGVGAGGVLLFFALAKLFSPAPPGPVAPSAESLARARAIAQANGETSANLALLGDKMLLFSESGRAFIMYGMDGRSWVALGDPVGPEEERADLVWRFRELCDRYGAWCVFYEVGENRLPLYLDVGLSLLKLGEEARVPLAGFSLDGPARKDLRYAVGKAERDGAEFEVVPPEEVAALLPELRAVSESWLAEKHVREKGFSLGRFREDYIAFFPVAVVRRGGRIVAFANLWTAGNREEVSVDLMRHLPDAPNGVMDYLFARLMVWGAEEGYRWFNLGMAPLSGLESRAVAPLWNRLGALVYRHGEHFYNFQGLRRYKEKFVPEWRSRYLATPGGLVIPRVLASVAALISGGLTATVRR